MSQSQPPQNQQPEVPEISVHELKEKLDRGEAFELIDVREPSEHQRCRIDAATLMPMNTVPERLDEFDASKQYIVHCKKGGRSARVVQYLRERGIDAVNVTGGMLAWVKEIDPSQPAY